MDEAEEHKVWVGGLDWNTKERALERAVHSALGSHVKVASIRLMMDRDTGKSKGYAFVGFHDPELVAEAIDKMNGIEVEGRRIKVNDVRSKTPRPSRGAPRVDQDWEDRHDQRPEQRPERHDLGDKDRRHPLPGQDFRVAVSGLPEDYTWDKLKDFLRGGTSGGNSVLYANVSRPGFGIGDFVTSAEREAAIDALNNTTLNGCRIRVKVLEARSSARRLDSDYPTLPRGSGRDGGERYAAGVSGGGYDKADRAGGRDVGYEKAYSLMSGEPAAYEKGYSARSSCSLDVYDQGYGGSSGGRGDIYDKGYAEKGYVDKGYSDKAYVDKGYGDKDYADRGYADKGYADKSYVDRGYAEEGCAEKVYVDRGYADKGYVDKGYGERAYVEKGYVDKGYADKGYVVKGYADKGYVDKGYGEKAYLDRGYVDKGYRERAYVDKGYIDPRDGEGYRKGYAAGDPGAEIYDKGYAGGRGGGYVDERYNSEDPRYPGGYETDRGVYPVKHRAGGYGGVRGAGGYVDDVMDGGGGLYAGGEADRYGGERYESGGRVRYAAPSGRDQLGGGRVSVDRTYVSGSGYAGGRAASSKQEQDYAEERYEEDVLRRFNRVMDEMDDRYVELLSPLAGSGRYRGAPVADPGYDDRGYGGPQRSRGSATVYERAAPAYAKEEAVALRPRPRSDRIAYEGGSGSTARYEPY